MFEELFDSARYARKNPFSFIWVVEVRPLIRSVVLRLKVLFRSNTNMLIILQQVE